MSNPNRAAFINSGQTSDSFDGIKITRTIERIALGEFDEAIAYAFNVPRLDGFYDLICHGFINGRHAGPIIGERYQRLDAQQLARIIKAQPDYHGQPVRLLVCWAGLIEDGLARQLSIVLNRPVLAATGKIWVDFEGGMVLEGNSTWRCFTRRQVEDVDPQA